jgi:hypothetical protein
MLTNEAMVAEPPQQKPDHPMPGGGGMGGGMGGMGGKGGMM